ncbi:MAG: T9SS type A sorting domain-containing protein [Flavobacteriales bacterium]
MKKHLLIITLALSTFTGYSQSLGLIEPVTDVFGTVADLGATGELVAEWGVENIGSAFIEVRAKRVIMQNVSGTVNYFCWGVCFDETTSISPLSVSQDMNPGDVNNTFYAHYRPQNNAGEAIIKYCFFDAANTADETCQEVHYCVDCEQSVGEGNALDVELSEVSPNPVRSIGSISYSFQTAPENAKLVIYNMVGSIVKETVITAKNGIFLINAADFESGVYLYSIQMNGKASVMKKLVIAH